jgi:hypothetical protein
VTPDKPDPIEFYGVLALQAMLHCGKYTIERRIGPQDGVLRWGCMDAPIWLAERAQGVQCRDIPHLTWFTANEGARFAGVTRSTFKRIMEPPLGCVVSGKLWGDRSRLVKPLWTEAQCYQVRQRIKEGSIKIHWRSLTRPLLGVTVAPPRHCLAESQSAETAAVSKAQAWTQIAF